MAQTPTAEDAAVVAAEAFAPISFGEGARIGCVGDTRCGKTEAMKRLIGEYMRRSPGPVLIADNKEARPQFEGQCRRDKEDVQKNPPDPEPRVVILRGDRSTVDVDAFDPEEVAELQHELAMKHGMPSLGVIDELDRACRGGRFKREKSSSIKWAFKQGGSNRVSVLWGTQETQDIPAEIFNQSSMLLVFRMQGAPLRLLKERGYLEPKGTVENVIPTLPGEELPREERGYFVALRRGRTWDGKVWRFK